MNKELAAEILGMEDRRYANVRVPEWGNKVFRLRSWTCGDRIDFDAESAVIAEHLDETERSGMFAIRVVAWSLVDGEGSLVFGLPDIKRLRELGVEKKIDEGIAVYRALQKKGAKPLQRLYSVASILNLFDEDDDEALEKN